MLVLNSCANLSEKKLEYLIKMRYRGKFETECIGEKSVHVVRKVIPKLNESMHFTYGTKIFQ